MDTDAAHQQLLEFRSDPFGPVVMVELRDEQFLLAVGQRAHDRVANILHLEEFDDLLDHRAGRDLLTSRPAEEECRLDDVGLEMHVPANENILDHSAMAEQRQVLERASNAAPDEPMRPLPADVLPVEQNAAAARAEHAADHVEQRGLARAIRTDHTADLPPLDAKADIVDGPQTAELLAQRLDLQDLRHDSHRLRRL